MAVQAIHETLRSNNLLFGLNQEELAQVANLGKQRSISVGEICQTEGQSTNQVQLILKGRVGTVVRIPNITYSSNEIILDTLTEGDAFGWSSLIKGSPWSTLKALEPTVVLYINADELLNLCESNNHIGYILMKNLAALISSRLRRNRMSMLNALVAIKGV